MQKCTGTSNAFAFSPILESESKPLAMESIILEELFMPL